MMGDNIKTLEVDDGTGVRKNALEILEHHRNRELEAICVVWRLKDDDKTQRVFWNGDLTLLKGLLFQALYDLAEAMSTTATFDYEKSLDDDDERNE